MTLISDISIWHLYLTFIFDVYIWHFYLTFMSGMWFHAFSTTVFKTVVKNVLNTYFSTVFKKAVKNVLDRQTLCFTVAIFSAHQKQYTFSTNSNETRRIWGILAAPVVANSGKNIWFPYVNSNSRGKCIECIFNDCFQNSREKHIRSPNPLFSRCIFSHQKQYTFSNNSNETRRI